ncbi:hypothetical protein DRQ26_06685 [bacterium]|nr:MAG: hypothetical protein DRQ26_06685 [bacterium]
MKRSEMVNTVLLDTNIVNYILLNDSHNLKVFEDVLHNKEFGLSFVTVAELILWALSESNEKLRIIINDFISECRIFQSNIAIAHRAAEIALKYNMRSNNSSRFSKRWHDIWIAATAIEQKVMLITNNIKDFKGIDGLNLFYPVE